MTGAERKRVELSNKLLALARELAQWRAISARNGQLEKHHSQIARLATQLETALARLQARLDAPDSAAADPQGLEASILDVHAVWDFFRSKFVLRTFAHFREYLELADEVAYACYKPATLNAGERLREPPLTFLGAKDTSPYAMRRDAQYLSDRRASTGRRDDVAVELLRSLPIPVVGLPWFQLGHLPDLAIIAHEVGHHVEDDLGLHRALDDALRGAAVPPERLAAWLAWRGETFADVYATRSLGRAFVAALFDFVMTTPADLLAERLGPRWGDYPTSVLRLHVTTAVLEDENTVTNDDTARLAALAAHAMPEFQQDCLPVARAMLATTIPGENRTVRDLISFTRMDEGAATQAAGYARLGVAISNTTNPRHLMSATVASYVADPANYARAARPGDRTRDDMLRKAMRAAINPGIRNTPRIDAQEASVAARAQHDRERGEQLLASLGSGRVSSE